MSGSMHARAADLKEQMYAILTKIGKASGKMKNKVPGEKKPTLAKQLAGVPEKLMTYMKGYIRSMTSVFVT
eukprot:scaffold197476_cov14-Tisochrysis_lutea.AAC.1